MRKTMTKPKKKRKRRRGRPVTKPMPEPIDDSAKNVLRAVLATPPKRNWRYQENGGRRP